jgi:5-formyltetrahydrofolate cyclo-ligase
VLDGLGMGFVTSIADQKAALRGHARRARRACYQADHLVGGRAAHELALQFLEMIPVAPGTVVAGYWPMGTEIDPRPLLQGLRDRGVVIALPVALAPDAPLAFRLWDAAVPLVPDCYGIAAPAADQPLLTPSIILVPLLAFDRHGGRLGQGGGHYDRTLAALRAAGPVMAVGVAYAGQEQEALPTEAHDERLDGIVTEEWNSSLAS